MTDDWFKEAGRRRQAKVDGIDPAVPNLARVWNYLIGGKDNFEADRKEARQLVESSPLMAEFAPAVQGFRRRMVSFLAAEAGIRQFLAVGTAIPSDGNLHEVAHSVAPQCRIVFVDDDPLVLAHARALHRSSTQGVTSHIGADIRDAATIIASARETLDFGSPVALMLATLCFVEGDGEVAAILGTLLDAVAPGSYLAVLHPASDLDESLTGALRKAYATGASLARFRDREAVTAWFDGLELVEPGVVEVHKWRPADGDPAYRGVLPLYGAVGRKP
jgi:hypothetical protein